jgi:type IV pilus assembly protein PilQ
MVEPKFQPKAETAAPTEQPETNARSTEAASKFASNAEPVPLSSRPVTSQPATLVAMATPEPQVQPARPAAQPSHAMAQPPAPGRPGYSGEPISVNLKDVDLKDFFRLIHEISGLNIVLDPNVKGTLTLVLDDVPWDQALDIVLKNNSLDRELDGNVLRIATIDTLRKESDARRAQIEAKVLAEPKITVTRFLSYAHSKDLVPTIKKFLSARGEIIADDRTNGLIIQDIPGVFVEIDRLLTQLDRKTPEVEIEARVVAATRNFARDIGTQLGIAFGNGPTAVGGASSAGNSPISVTPPTGAPPPPFITDTTGKSIPLFTNMPAGTGQNPVTSGLSLLNMGSNYRLDAILTMAESRGLLKILSRPRVITQNNIQAVIRQGFKIPIVTLAQLGGPPTTTYIDAFLRLTVTPQITVENTIFLNVDVENTTPDFGRVINGNPTLITQQALTQVLVADGGTVVIGGVIETQNNVSVSQVPLLGDIPVLGNLFKRRSVSSFNRELFFFITPRIIQT